MLVLLVRHAQAAEQDAEAFPDDSERPLVPKGRRVRLGFVGAGSYATSMLLPHLAEPMRRVGDARLTTSYLDEPVLPALEVVLRERFRWSRARSHSLRWRTASICSRWQRARMPSAASRFVSAT